MYAKRSPEDVYKILMSFGTDFVILEDSICYERRHNRGCRLRDLLDVENGHVSLCRKLSSLKCMLHFKSTSSLTT